MPILDERADFNGISPQYAQVMSAWLEQRLAAS
jgi:hypothetical protein